MAFDKKRAGAALMASLRAAARAVGPGDRDAIANERIVLDGDATASHLSDHLARAYQIGVSECLGRISELETEIQKIRSDLAASEEALARATVEADSLNTAMRQVRAVASQALRI